MTDQEIINAYQKLKSMSAVSIAGKIDYNRVRKVIVGAGIKLQPKSRVFKKQDAQDK